MKATKKARIACRVSEERLQQVQYTTKYVCFLFHCIAFLVFLYFGTIIQCGEFLYDPWGFHFFASPSLWRNYETFSYFNWIFIDFTHEMVAPLHAPKIPIVLSRLEQGIVVWIRPNGALKLQFQFQFQLQLQLQAPSSSQFYSLRDNGHGELNCIC